MTEQNTVTLLLPKDPYYCSTKARLFVNGKWHKITGIELGVIWRDSIYNDFQFTEEIGQTIKAILPTRFANGFLFNPVCSFSISKPNKVEAIVRRSGRVMWVAVYDSMNQDIEGVKILHE